MKEVTIKVYTIDELAEEAKKYAIDKNRQNIGNILNEGDAEEYRIALTEIEKAFDIKVYEWSVDSISHDFRFRLNSERWRNMEDNAKYLMRYLNSVAYPNCQEGKYYSNNGKIVDGKYEFKKRRSRVLTEPFSYVLTGTWCTEAIDYALEKAADYVREGRTILDWLTDMLEGFFSNWENDQYENYSDEAIENELSMNEYRFLADGRAYVY